MRCPSIEDLPAPPQGKTGWPWNEAHVRLPQTQATGDPWPRLTIVTPSYNQGRFIEETIRSILLQGYPDLEYIIIDGGSSDETFSILDKYSEWIAHWVSEPDKGQADALNKGIAVATGTIFNWINSDDLLLPNSLKLIASNFVECDAVAAQCVNFGAGEPDTVITSSSLSAYNLVTGSQETVFHQPALWLHLHNVRECGGIDSRYHYSFDWDLTIRYLYLFPRVRYVHGPVAKFRLHPSSKTVAEGHKMHDDRVNLFAKLEHHYGATPIGRECGRRRRQYAWWNQLDRLASHAQSGRWTRAARIFAAALRDPGVRCSRLTLGTMRECLFPSRSSSI
jgi:glycosyltransferase involved in cell wall biosynthesis